MSENEKSLSIKYILPKDLTSSLFVKEPFRNQPEISKNLSVVYHTHRYLSSTQKK